MMIQENCHVRVLKFPSFLMFGPNCLVANVYAHSFPSKTNVEKKSVNCKGTLASHQLAERFSAVIVH